MKIAAVFQVRSSKSNYVERMSDKMKGFGISLPLLGFVLNGAAVQSSKCIQCFKNIISSRSKDECPRLLVGFHDQKNPFFFQVLASDLWLEAVEAPVACVSVDHITGMSDWQCVE